MYTLLWSFPIISNEEDLKAVVPEVKEELAWRTTKSNKASTLSLYSVADGKIIQHNVQFQSGSGMVLNPNSKSLNLYNQLLAVTGQRTKENDADATEDIPIKGKTNFEYGLTEFSVLIPNKTDHKQYPPLMHFLIGKFDGSLELYKKTRFENVDKITKLCTLFNHQKLVTCSKWNRREVPNLIATGSNDFNVIIIDFERLLAKTDVEQNIDMKFYADFKHKLVGHKERITGLSWSNREDFNMLASCSYDATVQV